MPNRIYLGIDTATPHLSLALWSPAGGTLATFSEQVERDHAKRILSELERLFQSAGVSKSDVVGIGVGLGPGSYTGLRVGHATAQGLARGLGIAYGGRSTLAAVAARVLDNGKGVIALDARRENVYAGVFERRGDDVSVMEAPKKWARAVLQQTYPHLPYIEDEVPDASFLAQAFAEGHATDTALIYL